MIPRRDSSGAPWVAQGDAGAHEIAHVARDDGETVHQGRGGDEGVPVGARIGNLEPCAAAGDGLPRSVTKTGPFWAAFFARLVSWLNSRLDRVVMLMAGPWLEM